MQPALHVVQPGHGAATPVPGTIDYEAARFLREQELRVAAGDLEPQSLSRLRSYLGNFLSFAYADGVAAPVRIGSLEIRQARQSHITNWLLAHAQRWKTGSTRADAIGVVMTFSNWYADEHDCSPPFRRPRKLKFPRQHFAAWRKHHYRAIMLQARKRRPNLMFRLAMFFAWHTGCRLAEMRRLEWDHIDWAAEVCSGVKNKTGHMTGKKRIFGFGPRLLGILRQMHAARKPGQRFVFLTTRGKQWSKDNLGRRWAFYRELAGVPKNIKAAGSRHGFAVRLKLAGHESKAIADQLGNSPAMIDQIYTEETRHDADHLRRTASAAERTTRRPQTKPKSPPKRNDPPSPLFDGLG